MQVEKHVLVVDDSSTVRQQLEFFLEPEGYAITTAANAEEGLAAAATRQFDLCIIDVNMPGKNGLEMIRELRAVEGYKKTPMFVLTTESTKNIIDVGTEVGATAWIVKPFKQDLLLKGIRKVLAG
jgi:two-component system, chemotaxis family, chemotaxis protein CheY